MCDIGCIRVFDMRMMFRPIDAFSSLKFHIGVPCQSFFQKICVLIPIGNDLCHFNNNKPQQNTCNVSDLHLCPLAV